MPARYSLGLDFGTNSMRAIIVDVADGRELASVVSPYRTGDQGIITDDRIPDLARQNPKDYLHAIESAVTGALRIAAADREFSSQHVIGIGIDATGSTPMPVDQHCRSLASLPAFATNPNAMAWLWKDHTAHAEAEQITAAAATHADGYLKKCGGRYSSEWFWAKMLHCAKIDPQVSRAAYTWVEFSDWIPAVLTGVTDANRIRRNVCAAGHKAMFHPQWGGYPNQNFLASLHPDLGRFRQTLAANADTIAMSAGPLSDSWSARFGLPKGIPVAIGAIDAHMGAIGAGIAPGTMVKIMGTSTCDIMVAPMDEELADIPGLCGIVPESVLPNCYGLEAGQSAVGDIFNWFARLFPAGATAAQSHESLTQSAANQRPGESGLLALDWHNGNRTVLVDQRLTGLILGLTLATTPPEIYRCLIEATAMGARVIVERLEEFGVPVRRVITCGGISARNSLAMQIYADVMNRPIALSRSEQTCALGAAIAGAVVAGRDAGGYADFPSAMAVMTDVQDRVYTPDPAAVVVYEQLYRLYLRLHDAFGISGHEADLSDVMKQLLEVRDRGRGRE